MLARQINRFFLIALFLHLSLGAGGKANEFELTDQEKDALNKVIAREGEEGNDTPLSLIQVPVLEIMPEDQEALLPNDLSVVMKTLDKVTARTQTMTLRINEPVRLGRLSITMRSCSTNSPEEEPETRVFLEVDEDQEGAIYRLFTGWMFASSPSINALEHPVHDLWPIICKTSDGAIFSGIK